MIPTEVEVFTWVGAVLLALCGLPQAVRAYRRPESTRGLSWAFLSAWGFGELAMTAGMLGYVSWHVIGNYLLNITFILYMSAVKWNLPPGAEH